MAKKKTTRPIDMEKRLATAFEAGKYDGYCEGLDDAHQVWALDVCNRTPGVGPKIQAKLIVAATELMKERQAAKFGQPDPGVELVRTELKTNGR